MQYMSWSDLFHLATVPSKYIWNFVYGKISFILIAE